MSAFQPWTSSLLQLAESFALKLTHDLGFRRGVNENVGLLGCDAA